MVDDERDYPAREGCQSNKGLHPPGLSRLEVVPSDPDVFKFYLRQT